MSASVVAPASTRPGTPATTRIPSIISIRAIVVPRSGSTTIRAAKRQVSIPIGFQSSASVRGAPFPARYAAAQISNATFASSDGWNVNGPAVSQRFAPLISGAITSTAVQSPSAASTSGGARSAQPPVVEAGEEEHQGDAGESVDPLALEERDRIAVSERCGRRGRAVDHDESEGHEPERDEDEQTLLELTSIHPLRFSTSLLNSSPRCSKSRNWS